MVVQGNLDGGGPNSPFPIDTVQQNSTSVPSSPRERICPSTENGGIDTIATIATNERRNIYGLPHPQPTSSNQPTTSSTTASTSSDDHVFAVPSPTSSNRHFASGVNGGSRHSRPHSYHQNNLHQTRVHNHHHDQAHHSANYYQQHHHSDSANHQYHQSQNQLSNDFNHSQSGFNSFQKPVGVSNQYSSQFGQRHRTLSEQSPQSSSSPANGHHMRNSFSDSQLDRTIKKEGEKMGDYDDNPSDNSIIQHSSTTHDPNDTSTPLTNEEIAFLEAKIQGQGQMVTSGNRLLNTPQVSFTEQNPNSQAPNSQRILSGEQNWEQTLHHYDRQQNPNTIQVHDNGTGQAVSSGLEIAMGRADTLDRIPVFVNPHDLNQTSIGLHGGQQTTMNNTHTNPSTNFNEVQGIKQDDSAATTLAVTQSHQSQITVANASTQQVILNNGNTVNVIGDNSGMVNTSGDLWNLGDIMAERLVADQLTHSYQIESAAHSNSTQQAVPGPTGPNPSIDPYPGDYHFKVEFHRLSDNIKNKSWDFSEMLKQLFIDMNKPVQAMFRVGPTPPEGLFIRALPIYAVAGHISEPVTRCPNHASLEDSTNRAFNKEYRHHLIRVSHDRAVYQTDQSSQRLSVIVPVERPQPGGETFDFSLRFMCLGSDVGGINRRPLKVIFTLEDHNSQNGEVIVLGRYTVDVRICSCPKRDMQQAESKFVGKEKRARHVANELGRTTSLALVRTNSSITLAHHDSTNGAANKDAGACSKKRKVDKDGIEEMIMVPVAKSDWLKLDEFAEGAMIARNVSKAAEIKHRRKSLLRGHNPNLFKPAVKPKEEKSDHKKE